MKMYIKILPKILIVNISISLILFSSCQSPVEPIESDSPSIYFESNGFTTLARKLLINKSGLATYEIIYPTLQLQLSEEEFIGIKSYLKNFGNYQDSYNYSNILDDTYYTITLKTDTRSRTIGFSGYSMRNNPELGNLEKLTDSLLELCRHIYNKKSTWEGLTYQYSLNNSEYSQSDTIKFSCKIKNPTDIEKCIYFRSNFKIQLIIQGNLYDEPYIYLFLPSKSDIEEDTISPSKILLNPGEEKEVTSSFDQRFFDPRYNVNYEGLPKGTYTAVVHLLGPQDINGGSPFSNKYVLVIK